MACNVTSRWTQFGVILGSTTDFTETYGYDILTNRLEDRTISIATGSTILPANFKAYQDFNYDDWGNIKFKTGVGNYTYYATKPHQLNEVKSASGAQLYKFFYDANGNSKTDGTRTFTYGSYDKPTLITKAGSSSTMKYGPERELIFKTDTYVENGKNVTYQTTYLGNYEKVYRTGGAGTLTEHKFYIGDIIFTQRSNGSIDTFYLHKDHQGSVIATTNASGAVVSQAIYDPWGKRTAVYLASLLSNYTYSEPTDRGYTGHKHIKDLDIIHMGGRIYDPTLGRFLQADPFIQAPLDSQSYNRYAYVRNNPMSMTDPTGYFIDSLTKLAGFLGGGIAGAALSHHSHKFIANSNTLTSFTITAVGAVTGVFCGPCNIGFTALASSNLAYYRTGSLKSAFHAGLTTAVTAGVFYGIGRVFNGTEGFFQRGGAGHIAAHAIAGGVLAELQGGKFGHGFLAAGITKGFQVSGSMSNNSVIATLQSAVVGGTVSRITGGKFANGAMTAAFQYLFNHASARFNHPDEQLSDWLNSIADDTKSLWNALKSALSTSAEGTLGANAGVSANVLVAGGSFEKGKIMDSTGQVCSTHITCGRFGPGIGSSISVIPSIGVGPKLAEGGAWHYGVWADGPGVQYNILTDMSSGAIGRPVFDIYDTSVGAGVHACYVEVYGCN